MSQIIKQALRLCSTGSAEDCLKCPYRKLEEVRDDNSEDCWVSLTNDTLAYISTLEQRNEALQAEAPETPMWIRVGFDGDEFTFDCTEAGEVGDFIQMAVAAMAYVTKASMLCDQVDDTEVVKTFQRAFRPGSPVWTLTGKEASADGGRDQS